MKLKYKEQFFIKMLIFLGIMLFVIIPSVYLTNIGLIDDWVTKVEASLLLFYFGNIFTDAILNINDND